ncbi:flagellar hook assembly protein FlgD [Erythrobacter sp. HL-111]|uniref:flagellar hook assembly protein FlgD n=1 Tax=Erythrobacter sp. HL-111 TaxID=1798193 RepID=UPI0006DA7A74|nr:flagellar hook capping FlgD N-terminal domain-containing protein [Erythrobacter sp. HL-111]KPP92563.1 MAG: flagellar basal-body rod modification protein FlgD [Erythrobacteraceae bacterium HL-111]SDS92126.1 flagellar basal-body rod modification protein FlgD [Erythrobacter sp. HL-111]
MDPIPPGAQAALDRLNAPSRLPRADNPLASLDSGDFLRLLTTQLTIQDPLEPVDNEQMLAQMAQFSALAATSESGATLEGISAKLDRLIEAQEAARAASEAAAEAARAAAAAAPSIA